MNVARQLSMSTFVQREIQRRLSALPSWAEGLAVVLVPFRRLDVFSSIGDRVDTRRSMMALHWVFVDHDGDDFTVTDVPRSMVGELVDILRGD